MATGGAGLTSYEKFGMIYMNPAAFALPENGKFSLLKIGANINYDWYNLYTVYNTMSQNNMDLSKLSSTQWKSLLNLRSVIGVTGPLALGYMWDGIGLLLYNDILTSMSVKQAPGLPYVDFGAYADLGFMVGFGFKIPMPVFLGKFTQTYGGITIKYINRFKYENPRLSLLEAYDLGMSLMTFQKGFYWGQAIGSDIGFLIRSEQWSGGLVIRDWFQTQFNWTQYSAQFQPITNSPTIKPTYFAPALDIGGSYRFKTVLPKYMISDLILSLDIANSVDFTENYFLKLRLGAEISVLSFLKLRGGVYKGYPTVGFGIVIPFFNLSGTYYTEELGEFPGNMSQQNFVLEMQVVI